MEEPFNRHGRAEGSPFLLLCEHAGWALPSGTPLAAENRSLLRSHWGWDPGAWELTKALSDSLGTGAFGGRLSRLWVDLNRSPDDPEIARARAGDDTVPWNLDLGAVSREARLAAVHRPYHDAIEKHLHDRHAAGEQPWIISVHTFTARYPGAHRTFEAAVLFDKWEKEARLLARLLQPKLDLRFNEPWSGREGMMYSAERHGSRHGLRCLELEWNQSMLTSTRAVERAVDLLAPALLALVSETS